MSSSPRLQPVLRATGLVKTFGETRAVDGVDLVLSPGEIRGLLGPNGAGKTTLLRLLFGLVLPDTGEVELFGRRLRADDASALDATAGFVEAPAFYPYLSGRANLEVLARLDDPGAGARIDQALAQVMLGQRAGDRISGYSTGMRQRLGIAAALVRAPRLLLLDEPTSGLDPAGVRDVAALLHRLAADGVTVLLSSHQIGELEGMCSSYTFLRQGRQVWTGTATELRSQAPSLEYRLTTSDDGTAFDLARGHSGVRATPGPQDGIYLTVESGSLDPYVVELGSRGIAIRSLEVMAGPLETMFFALTGEPPSPQAEGHVHAPFPHDLVSHGG
jgi:ABC-2 type transport system ATP-binding protein